MKPVLFSILLTVAVSTLSFSQKLPSSAAMTKAAQVFINSLSAEQKQIAVYPFENEERFNWYYFPHERKGLPLKKMTPEQRQAAMALLKTTLSEQGNSKIEQTIDLENVLRVVENRPPNDTYRDPENYYFTIFGDPSQKNEPWSWRLDGHHVCQQFSAMHGDIIAFTPSFWGSNPGIVKIDVPQKGRFILKQEAELAFNLLNALTEEQLTKAVISANCPNDIFTTNKRKALLEKREGVAFGELTKKQQKLFMNLLNVYLNNYHVTLKNQQLDKLKAAGLDQLTFAWSGDREPGFGPGKGQYYRIHGPTILIEFDNSQNQANHIHTVVRDLSNDFGDDILQAHYNNQHK